LGIDHDLPDMWCPAHVRRSLSIARLIALQGELAPASPRNTSTARFRRTMSSSLRRPIFLPILVFATVVILSIMRLQGFVKPFLSLGVMGNRNNGADVGFVVNGQNVIDNVPTNLSSCTITTGRGLPA
jgi:hypothetical protein